MAEHHWFWSSSRKNIGKIFRPSHSRSSSYSSPRQITNKLVSETFWPDSIDKESGKAARILYSFCKYGMYQDEARDASNNTTQKQKMWSRIPQDVIANAKGIVVITVMRAGLWVSGAGGSGVVLARTPKGSWSWPVAVEVHTSELGFLVGSDIYDCVLVLNTTEALEAFSKARCVVGGDLYATPGPLGVGWFFDKDARSRQSPIFSYLRSRGYYAAVQLDHAVFVMRNDENSQFYQLPSVTPKEIFLGNHIHRPASCLSLLETLKASEGATEVDETRLAVGPPPSDFEVVEEGHAFGVPDKEDPDPFGVLALEKQGLLIKEAGTNTSPGSESFEFNPSITSPIYSKYNRRSVDGHSVRSSWRRSAMSTGDRLDSSSVLSRETDQESMPPASPGLNSNFQQFQMPDNESKSFPGARNLANGDQLSSRRPGVGREHSYSSWTQRTNGLHSTIEEDEVEAKQAADARLEPETDTAAMDDMLNELHGHRRENRNHGVRRSEPMIRFSPDPQDVVNRKERRASVPLAVPSVDSRVENKDDQNDDPKDDQKEDQKDNLDKPEPSTQLPDEANEIEDVTLRKLDPPEQSDEDRNNSSSEQGKERGAIPLTIQTANLEPEQSDGNESDNESFESASSPVEIRDAVFQGGAPSTVYQAVSTITMPKARIVEVPKLQTPAVPARNPGRVRLNSEDVSLDERRSSEVAADQDLAVNLEKPSSTNVNRHSSPNLTSDTYLGPSAPIHSRSKSFHDPISPIEVDEPTVDTEASNGHVEPTTLMDIHKGLNASPTSELSSPEDAKSYFGR